MKKELLRSFRGISILALRAKNFQNFSSGSPRVIDGVVKSFAPELTFPKGNYTNFLLRDSKKWQNLTAIECGVTGYKISYSSLVDQIRRWSGFLIKRGVQQGDVIAIVSSNNPYYVPIYLGTAAIGAILSPLNAKFTSNELSKLLNVNGAKMVIIAENVEENVDEALKSVQRDVVQLSIGSSRKGLPNVIHILKDESIPFADPVDLTGEEIVYLPFSSGTTGFPKAVALSHNAFISNILQYTNPYQRAITHSAADGPQENFMAMFPFFHIYGALAILSIGLFNGYRIVTLPAFEPSLFLSTITNHKIGYLHTVPTLLNFLNTREECNNKNMGHVHSLLCGAAPVLPSAAKQFIEKIQTPIDFIEGYGMTEVLITHILPRNSKKISGSQLASNVESKIVDTETGKSLSFNEQGEIWIRTPSRMKGYLNNEKATSEMITKDGWVKTGDIGFYDEEGYFFIVDRTKDLIKVKGLQVAPSEVEEVLQSHPSVGESSVIGIPHERFGEVPKAFVIPIKKVEEKELHQYVASKLSEHKQLIGGIEFVESLPKSDTGKVLKRELRKF